MAEVAPEKPPTLAEQYSLQNIKKTDLVDVSIEQTPQENTADASLGEIIAGNTSETAVPEFAEQKADETLAAEEVSATENTTNETTQEQDAEEPEIKIETAPADFRFPTTNQTRHCFTRYIEYHRCVTAKGEDAPECNKFAKYYRSLCPSEWVCDLFILLYLLIAPT
ncbi:hypothetical protein ZIOFF_029637 [Zingiber officinale]|uniref:Cytochrome c oxidase subunit 6b-1 n=1 Tax=Zingiber officinale TaxID=94328 RepID=A0A8J5H1V1_ZINOF|nr:hypothetical protein ZIOFF_029637 [Zingiber officinale]